MKIYVRESDQAEPGAPLHEGSRPQGRRLVVSPAQSDPEHLENRLEFETLISDLSSRFINLPAGEVDREIEDALRRVCELLGIDSCGALAMVGRGPDVITPTHIYAAREGPQASEPMRQEQFPWFVQQMLAGRTVAVSSLEDLPAEAAVDRESARLLGIKSNLMPPALGGGRAARWRSGLQYPAGASRLAGRAGEAAATGRASLHQRARSEAPRAEPAGERGAPGLAADSAEAGLWTLDYSTGVFWATERARAIFGYPPDEVISMERFEASVHPDDWDSSGEPSSGPRVRANPSTWNTGSSCRGDGGVAVDRFPRAAPSRVHRRAGATDGPLHRHHRAEARRRGASRERGSPGGGHRPRRPRVLRGGLRRRRRLRRRPVSRHLRCSPGTGGRACRPWSSGWSICTPTTAKGCWTCAGSCTTGRWSGSISSIASCIRAQGEKWIHHMARVVKRDATGRTVKIVRCPPRHHGEAAKGGDSFSRRSRRYSGSATACRWRTSTCASSSGGTTGTIESWARAKPC